MELLVVRHGQSVADIEGRHEGQADFALTQLGQRQAVLVAAWIGEYFPPGLVVSSPLQRSDQAIPGGESEIEFQSRVERTFLELQELDGSRRVAVVAHGGTITMLFRAFLGLPLGADMWITTGDTGIHRWQLAKEGRAILASNMTEHLAALTAERLGSTDG